MQAKVLKLSLLTVAACIVLWLLGVYLSGLFASDLISQGLESVNGRLESRAAQGVLEGDLQVSYVKKEDSFFSESGQILVENRPDKRSFTIPVAISHDFLGISADLDFYHFLNSLFLKKGILGPGSSLTGRLKVALLPYRSNFYLSLKGLYAQSYLLKDPKHLADYDLPLEASVYFGSNIFDFSSFALSARNLAAPSFNCDGIYLRADSSDLFAVGRPARFKLTVDNLFARGTLLDGLDDAEVMLKAGKAKRDGRFDLGFSGTFESRKGPLKLDGTLGPFSVKAFHERKAEFYDLLLNLYTMNSYFADETGTLRLNSLLFNADYAAPHGQVHYVASAKGGLNIPRGPALNHAFSEGSGVMEVDFKDVSEGAEKLIDLLQRSLFQKNGSDYHTEIRYDRGRLTVNGKQIF